MKGVVSILVLTFLMLLAPSARSGDRPDERASIWMKQKLRASQEVLKGLADGDFESAGANAQTMNLMTYLEKWARADRPEYKTQLRLFEFADRELIKAASQQNLDAATLAYTQLTISCVNCHRIVRAAK
jgi:cytochrome c556